MTAKTTDTKPHYATRDFTDAGTGRSFSAGAELKDIEDGQVGNYAAAGLATDEKPKAAKQQAAAPTA